ncbi:MAG: alpha-E domain-containing protein [Gammaproteobacteria bacterium]|nr:alpha-E domain-containing protein [Gammaproteobacteria bacterium]
MLSRVAERIYWVARYIERTENTARLVNVYSDLMLDLPDGVGLQWRQLIDISGAANFSKRYRSAGERNVLRFMLCDRDNPNSVLSCLAAARENVRTTRDLVPSEGWENVNELYLFGRKKFGAKNLPKGLYEVLSQVVGRCQQITGLLAGTMSHGDAYRFLRIGRHLERADMTTRIVDVGSATLIASGAEILRLENRLWMNVLRALSAYQMYRQHVRRRIKGTDAIAFLLQDTQFPRAVAHSLAEIQDSLQTLPRNDATLRAVGRARRLVNSDVRALSGEHLHRFIDDLQAEIGAVHTQVESTWFAPELDEAV